MTILDDSVVDNLILQTREQLDESNTTDVSDPEILRALNRAQKKFVRIASKKYPALFMREATKTLSDFSGRELELPEAAFGIKINEFHNVISGVAYEVLPATTRQASHIETDASSDIGQYYALRGNKLLIYPKPASSGSYRIRYQIRPPDLVKQQGRITNIDDIASGEFYVDDIGSDLTTSISDLKAFINIIDGTTGLVKTTLQVSALDTTNEKITVKTSGLNRSVVFGRTVDSAIPTTVGLDDYVCLAYGTCIPTLARDWDDFLVAYATLEVRRSKGEDTNAEYAHMKELEADVQMMWAGRPAKQRVARRNRYWGRVNSLTSFFRY